MVEIPSILRLFLESGVKYGHLSEKFNELWHKLTIISNHYPHRKLIEDCWNEKFINKELYKELKDYHKERNIFTHNVLKYWEYKKEDFEEQYKRGMSIKLEMEKRVKLRIIKKRDNINPLNF